MLRGRKIYIKVSVGAMFLLFALTSKAQYALYGTAVLNNGTIELTQALNSSAGGAYDTVNLVNLNQSFTMRFIVNLGNKDGNGADGMTFLFRDIKSQNLSVFGQLGGGLGVNNLIDRFICVEFDTYQNSNFGDPSYDHLAVMTNTIEHNIASSNLAGPAPIDANYSNIEDGNNHEIGIKWDATAKEMRVYFDCLLRMTVQKDLVNAIFGGDSLVYYGATAATGGLNNLQTIKFDPEIEHYDTITASCGDTSLLLQFPDDIVNCQSISLDGTEFRLQDSTARQGTFYSGKYVGVHSARGIACNSNGQTDKVRIELLDPLYKGLYVLRIKKGSDQTTLSPFCDQADLGSYQRYDMPEFTFIVVKVEGNVGVNLLDSNNLNIADPGITVCLPKLNPFPYLKAFSNKAVDWAWTYNGDTIPGQNVNYAWANQDGTYKIFVKDAFNCTGSDEVEIIFDTIPEFHVEVPLYCDLYGEVPSMPSQLSAPVYDPPWLGNWEWHLDGLGLIQKGDTLDVPQGAVGASLTLKYIKPAKVFGGKSCLATFSFDYDRINYPPLDSLFVAFPDSFIDYCSDLEEEIKIYPWREGIRNKYAPLNYSWYINDSIFISKSDTLIVQESGKYTLLVMDSLGCWGQDSVQLVEVERMESFPVYCDIPNAGMYRFFWDGSNDAVDYQISYDQGKNWQYASESNAHIVSQQVANQIMVRAELADVCNFSLYQSSEECPIQDIFIPNVVTPNEDGLNDVFDIRGLQAFPNSSLKIFNRWGTQIYGTSDYQNDWTGSEFSDGVYYYTLELNNPEQSTFNGSFSILR